nr:T9SS type A sorting domain-containing protein [Saprospiraceae bacterium]
MKKYTNLNNAFAFFLLLATFIYSNSTIAQPSSQDGNITSDANTSYKLVSSSNSWTNWFYGTWFTPDNKPVRYRFSEDSVQLGDRWYLQLKRSFAETGDNWEDMGLFREENGVVYLIVNNEEQVLMNFNSGMGDQLDLFRPGFDQTLEFTVVSVDTVELMDGSHRKRLGLSCFGNDGPIKYWVEGIGSLKNAMGIYHCAFHVQDRPLLCFFQNGEMIYFNENYGSCWLTSVEDLQDVGISIFPNPAIDHLNILFENPSSHPLHFRIIHSNGAIINSFKHPGMQTDLKIRINDLQAGIYHLSWDFDGSPFSYRFVVSK